MKKRDHLEDCELDTSGSVEGPVPGSCEHSNERVVSIKGAEVLD
jgi:hypothetical protein